jgi:hypothetical protein
VVPDATRLLAWLSSSRSALFIALTTLRQRLTGCTRLSRRHLLNEKENLLPERSHLCYIDLVPRNTTTQEPPVALLWPDPKRGPWSVLVHWRIIDGRPECTGLDLRHGTRMDGRALPATSPSPITASALRDLRPDALIRAARARRVEGLESSVEVLHNYIRAENEAAGRGRTAQSPFTTGRSGGTKSKFGAPATAGLRARTSRMREPRKWPQGSKPRGRPKGKDTYPPEHWERVAEVYQKAWEAGVKGPTSDVEVQFDVTYSTARNWVSRCRSKGLLASTTRGKAAGGPSKKRKGQP